MSDPNSKHRYSWNLALLFKSNDDPEIEKQREIIKEKSYEFINKWKDRTDYLENPMILKEALDEYEEWARKYGSDGNEGYFFWLQTMLDQANPNLKAKLNKVIEFAQKIENDIQFFTIRVAKVPAEKQKEFLEAPVLKEYRHFLETLFVESKYILSEPEEKIMNLKSKTSHSNWTQMVKGLVAKEEREVLTEKGKKELISYTEILNLVDNSDKEIRDDAKKALNDIYSRWVEVGENELNSILENKKINDELRGYERPDKARHIGDDIDTEVVDALLEAVTLRFETSQRFYELKTKLLKLPKLGYHEKSITYGEVDREFSFEESVELIKKVFGNLDPKFKEIFEGFLNEGRLDVYPKKGKYMGAFCTQGSVGKPIYILLNHTNKLKDVLTLAHELGHGINFELMKIQNELNYGSPMSTAEVTSTFMEDFVLQEILKGADDELKLSLMMMKLNDEISTIHRQIGCYNFELDLHKEFKEKGYLSKEDIGELFKKNMKAYLGKHVEMDEGSQNWWLAWGHIRSFFYVYSYASGLLISKSLQNSVKSDPNFIRKVIKFFEAGESDSPKNIFMRLGVDITDRNFWFKGLDEVDSLVTETEELAKKLNKI